jgi:hypothetical protein
MRIATKTINGVVITDGIQRIPVGDIQCDICKSHINYCSCKYVDSDTLAEVRAELEYWRDDNDK